MTRAERQAGVTLIELLIVIVIGSVVSGALLMTWFSLNDSYSFTTRSSEAQGFARDAVARMGRELRDAEAKGGSLAITSASSDEVSFWTTFNVQGNESRQVEPVLTQYYYQDGSLHRKRSGIDTVIVGHLLNQTTSAGKAEVFTYDYIALDSHRVTGGTDPAESMYGTVSMVSIHLVVDLNPKSAPQPMDVSTSVHLRNQGLD